MSNRHVISSVRLARTSLQRFVGLMGRKDLSNAYLLIPRCSSIHTCFMRGPIDVAFLDEQQRITELHLSVRPWRMVVARKGRTVLELPSGYLAQLGAEIGDEVECRQS